MDWVPIAFGTFKVRASAKVTGIFVLALLVVGGITLALSNFLGLDLSY